MSTDSTGAVSASRWRLVAATAAVVVFGLLAAIALNGLYQASRHSLIEERLGEIRQAANSTISQIDAVVTPVRAIVAQITEISRGDPGSASHIENLQAIATASVRTQKRIAGVFVGFPDGSFQMSITLPGTALAGLGVKEVTGLTTMRRSIIKRATAPTDVWLYYDGDEDSWRPSVAVPASYDPRTRPWYQAAVAARGPIWTAPYVFASAGELGITHAVPVFDQRGEVLYVIGVDFTLEDLSPIVRDGGRMIGGSVFIANEKGEVIAHTQLGEYLNSLSADAKARSAVPTLAAIGAKLDIDADIDLFRYLRSMGEATVIDVTERRQIAIRLPLSFESGLNYALFAGISEDVAIGKAVDDLRRNMAILGALLTVLTITIVYLAKLRTEVTLRRRTEAAMRDLSGQLTVALENMPGGIAMVDRDYRVQAFNRRYVETFDLPALAKGMPIQDIVAYRARRGDYGPGEPDAVVAKRMDGYRNLDPPVAEERSPSGRILEIRRSPTPDGGMVALFNDITERKKAEADLQRSEYALENAAEAIMWMEESGRLVQVNRMAHEVLGYEPGSLVGRHVCDIVATIDAKVWPMVWNAVKTRTRDTPGEQRFLSADGTTRPAETLSKFIAFGGREYMCTFFRDITERKQAEAEIKAAKETAEEATKAKSSFLAMMSHEIRTPMNGVMSMAEMLDQTELTADQRSMSSVIRASAQSLLTVINDILDFSKIEAGKLDIESVPFSLLEVVEGVGELMAARAEDKGLELIVDIDPTIPDDLAGDPTRLRQILLNLAGNAVKFTECGQVALRVMPLGHSADRLRFEIADTGIGLTAEQRAKLFQPFVQADTSTARKFGGTGLGLSICHRLVEMMCGRIGVDSEPGNGSTFWFELPLAPTDARSEAALPSVADARIAAIGFIEPGRTALAHSLSALGIGTPTWLDQDAQVGETLRSRLAAGPLIVLVRASSDGKGLETCNRLAAGDGLDGLKIVMVAARSLASTLVEADRIGLLATLTLPIRRQRLWHVIAAGLGRAQLDARQNAATSADIDWAPPDVATARAAGAVILVAEDNATNQIVIKRLLDQRGYAHEMAPNGAMALAQYRPGEHGMVLTDFHMPEMDGFQLTAAIRAREEGSDRRVPIVALTADALPGTEQRCLDAGMDGYLTKPIDSKALTAALARWLPQATALRRKAVTVTAIRPPEIDIDPQILDLARVRETFGGMDGAARDFLRGFIADVPRMIAEVEGALGAGDAAKARDAAHALKGAARSTGAVRLGQIAADIQDCLDGTDSETATMLAALLSQTHDELTDAARVIIA